MDTKLRVWWIPQIPMKPFFVPVNSVSEGVLVMDALAEYDKFQFQNNIKPDYCNAGGLQMFDEYDDTDSENGSWVDWYDEDTGLDDPQEWLSVSVRG